MTLGQRIQELRKQSSLSQEALGEKLGVSRQAISRWEMDGAVPEVDKLIALSKLFGITLNQLMGLEEPAPAVKTGQDKLARRWLAGLTALCLVLTGAVGLLWGQNRRQAQVLSVMDAEYDSYDARLFESVDYELSDLELGFPSGEGTQPLTVSLDMKPVQEMKGWDLTALHLEMAQWDWEQKLYQNERGSIDVDRRLNGTYYARFTQPDYGGEGIRVTAVFTQKGTGLVAKQVIFNVNGVGKHGIVEELSVYQYGDNPSHNATLPLSLALRLP